MGQVTIYLDQETERKMDKILRQKGVSKSKWISQLIKEKASATWPAHVAEFAGAWSDFPLAEEIRKTLGSDHEREKL